MTEPKITSIAELKRAVENLREGFMLRPYEKLPRNYVFRDDVLKSISEFEASVKKDHDEIEYLENIPTTQHDVNLMNQARAEELRRVLGEGGH